ncbi:unnamed protein product, partial [marine sediment metagenome]
VPLVDIPVSEYYWSQTKGIGPLIIDTDNVVVGDQVGETNTQNNIDGGGGIHAATYPVWGTVLTDPTHTQTDQPCLVDFCIE